MIEQLRESLNDIRIRLRLMFTRGRLTWVYPPVSGRMQTIQATGLAGEAIDGIEHAEDYGYAFHPLPGAEPFTLAVLGQRNQSVAIAIADPRERPTGLKPGEVMIWSAYGQRIHLKDDGGIAIYAPGDITAEGENVTIQAREDLRLRGKRIYRHAGEEDREDVAGYATGLRHDGGTNWTKRNWTDGATVTGETNPIEPPEVE